MTIPLPERVRQILLASPTEVPGERIIASPFQFWVTGEDNLRIQAATRQGGVTVVVQGRMLRENQELAAFAYDMPVPSTGFITQEDFPLGVGFLTNAVVKFSVDAGLAGPAFVSVQLIRGLTGGTLVLGTLIQGYVSVHNRLAWPGTPLDRSLEGEGEFKYFTGTTPAVSTEINEAIPSQTMWELVSLQALLTTGGIVATRQPFMRLGDSTRVFATVGQMTTLPANSSARFTWAQGVQTTDPPNLFFRQGPTPARLRLEPGQTIQTATNGLAVGDQWSAPNYIIREWLEFREIL